MLPFKKKNKLKRYDMNLDYNDLFTKIQRNSIQMIFIKDASIAMGKNKFGGTPHLPKTYQWPYYTGDIQDGSDRSNVMLAKISSNMSDDFELMFGDCGSIYFYIKKEDLKSNNFSRIWLILQCG